MCVDKGVGTLIIPQGYEQKFTKPERDNTANVFTKSDAKKPRGTLSSCLPFVLSSHKRC